MDLGGGSSEAPPSHASQSIRSLPGPEDLLDPSADPVDRGVPGVQLGVRLLLVAHPNRGRHDPRYAAFGFHRVAEIRPEISAVGEHFGRIVGQRAGPARPSCTLAGVTQTFSTKDVVASAPTWALKPCTAGRFLCLTQRPSVSVSLADAMIVASTSVPVLTLIDLALSAAVTVSNSARSSSRPINVRRKRTNAVRSGVGSVPEKPQKRQNDARSSSASHRQR